LHDYLLEAIAEYLDIADEQTSQYLIC